MGKISTNKAIVLETLEPAKRSIIEKVLQESPVALRPSVLRLLKGNGNVAILLCQFLYWTTKTPNAQGWFYNNQKKLMEQTGLGARGQLTARRVLIKKGLLEEKRKGVPARLHFRLNLEKLVDELVRAGFFESAHVQNQGDSHVTEQDVIHATPQTTAHVSQLYKKNNKETIKEREQENASAVASAPSNHLENDEKGISTLVVNETQHGSVQGSIQVSIENKNGSRVKPEIPSAHQGTQAHADGLRLEKDGQSIGRRQAQAASAQFDDNEQGQVKQRLWNYYEKWLGNSIPKSERSKELAALQELIDENRESEADCKACFDSKASRYLENKSFLPPSWSLVAKDILPWKKQRISGKKQEEKITVLRPNAGFERLFRNHLV